MKEKECAELVWETNHQNRFSKEATPVLPRLGRNVRKLVDVHNAEANLLKQELIMHFCRYKSEVARLLLMCWIRCTILALSIDKQKRFHPPLHARASGETAYDSSFAFETVRNGIEVLLGEKFQKEALNADSAEAIRSTLRQSFESTEKDFKCFARVLRNVRKADVLEQFN